MQSHICWAPSWKHHIPDIIRVNIKIFRESYKWINLLVCISKGPDSQWWLEILHSYLFDSIEIHLSLLLSHQEPIVWEHPWQFSLKPHKQSHSVCFHTHTEGPVALWGGCGSSDVSNLKTMNDSISITYNKLYTVVNRERMNTHWKTRWELQKWKFGW